MSQSLRIARSIGKNPPSDKRGYRRDGHTCNWQMQVAVLAGYATGVYVFIGDKCVDVIRIDDAVSCGLIKPVIVRDGSFKWIFKGDVATEFCRHLETAHMETQS